MILVSDRWSAYQHWPLEQQQLCWAHLRREFTAFTERGDAAARLGRAYDVPGVEPTNNAAERALRPAVLWRKGCSGTHSAAGSRFAERMLTVATTLKQQGRITLQSVEARFSDQSTPRTLLAS